MRSESFRISGMTCQGCKRLIESDLRVEPGVLKIEVDLAKGTGTVEYDETLTGPAKIASAVGRLNYKADFSGNDLPKKSGKSWLIFSTIALSFAFLYFAVDRLGWFQILENLNEPAIGYSLIFIIGVIASFHCVGMCGGFIVSYSSTTNAQTGRMRPHIAYNFGRLLSYTLVGGVLGAFGSFFAINPMVSGVLLIASALLMAALGVSFLTGRRLSMLTKVDFLGRIARKFLRRDNSKKPLGPFAIGLLTGLMPCGPLQAMQIYALSTGSAARGALSMAVYVLGTAPLLLAFGALIGWAKNKGLKHFFKYSGAVIIMLSLITMNRALANFGLGYGSFAGAQTEEQNTAEPSTEYQTVTMDVTYRGFVPNTLYVKKGQPVRWIINGKEVTGCTNEIIMPEYGIRQKIAKGVNIVEFTPREAGEIKFSCWMRMVWGKFIVTE